MSKLALYKCTSKHVSREFRELLSGLERELESYNKEYPLENKEIGILVGSRGIRNIRNTLSTVTDFLRKNGNRTYIIPAMGSHGNGTREGQLEILKTYGITEETSGSEIITSTDYLEMGKFNGRPVIVSSSVRGMDYLAGINRVKPHHRFSGKIESGLLKLITAGLGGPKGAEIFHRVIKDYGFEETVLKSGNLILKGLPWSFFVGVIEDCMSQTYDIRLVSSEKVLSEEPEMLKIAKQNIPTLPFSETDLLIVDIMGKNYSGGGIDTCVVGGGKGKERVARRVYLRRLSEESGGNAHGIGTADFISRYLFESIDLQKTYANSFTSMNIESDKIPIIFDGDYKCIETAFKTIGKKYGSNCRLAWINNTSELKDIFVTESMLDELNVDGYQIERKPLGVEFDSHGNLPLFEDLTL